MFSNAPFLIFVVFFVVGPCVPVVYAEEIGKNDDFFIKPTTKNYCILPPPPKNGNYTIVDGYPTATAQPGYRMQRYALKVTCDPGFQLVGDDSPSCYEGLVVDMPECLSLCQKENIFNVSCGEQLSCYVIQRTVPAPAQRHADDDECGRTFGVQRPHTTHNNLLAAGFAAQLTELPWYAGVYSKLYNPYKQICGGSLVSRSVVISAAHCFWNNAKQLPAENYAVAVGKIHRPLHYQGKAENVQQQSDVRAIHIPPRFYGSNTRFQEDLALLILASPITFTSAVKPVCLDFDYELDVLQLQNGAFGKVGGWGLLSEDGHESPILQVANLPYIDIKECVAGASPDFREYITSDKICAGYTNGTAVCKGDSGGGLAFPHTVVGETRYYLRGVVSAAPGSNSGHKCNVYHWATFTHVQRHQHFIQEIMKLNEKSQE